MRSFVLYTIFVSSVINLPTSLPPAPLALPLPHFLPQRNASQQPLYVAGARHGRPVIRFDGVNDFFHRLPITPINNETTVFAALRVCAPDEGGAEGGAGDIGRYVLYSEGEHPPQLRVNEDVVWEWNNGRERDNRTAR